MLAQPLLAASGQNPNSHANNPARTEARSQFQFRCAAAHLIAMATHQLRGPSTAGGIPLAHEPPHDHLPN